jgi:tryptophanyl-tRNA synthetase
MTDTLTPFREKRAYYEVHPREVSDLLADGEQRARERARRTMADVHTAMKLG